MKIYFLNFLSLKMLGRIYIIQSPYTDQVYIGSTTIPLPQRFYCHRQCDDCSSKLVIDEGDATIELLEEVKVIDKDELRFYEQQYIELYRDIAVNTMSAFGKDEERRHQWEKKYIIEHKEHRKQRYEENKEEHLKYMKNYRIKNKENYYKKQKERYHKNKEKRKEKITCECGSIIAKYSKAGHVKSKKHKNYIAQQ